MLLEKRGQITYFIVVGILLLIAVVGFLYFRGEKLDQPPEIEELDQDILPITNFVHSCLERYATEGVLVLGTQGGYIKIPPYIGMNPKSYVSSTQFGNFKVPFWYYEGRSQVPTINSMERDLAQYIKENLGFCLGEFEQFSNVFNIEKPEPQDIQVEATIGEQGVAIKLDYPLTLHILGEDGYFNRDLFEMELPVKLKHMHDLAIRIMERENNDMFFENTTIELMTLSDGRPPDGIPFSDIIFQCGPVQWSKRQVIESIKQLLFYNLPRVAVENTDAPGFPRNDVYAKNHFLWEVLHEDESDKFQDLGVGFYYSKEWPMEAYINPSQGDTMKASYGRGVFEYLKYICMNAYHFTYTLTYPLMVNVVDESAFNDKGFVFRFAFPVLVDHNEGNREDFTITQFEKPEADRDFCRRKQQEPFAIYAKEKATSEDITKVNVTFSCVDAYDCYLGETHHDAGVGRLSTLLPSFCSPGSIVLRHPQYAMVRQQLTSHDLEQRYVDIPMTPLNHLDFEVQKRKLINDQLQDPTGLEPGEYVVMFINSDDLDDFSIMREYPQLHGYTESQAAYFDNFIGDLSKVSLAEDDITYKVHFVLMNKDHKPIGGLVHDWSPSGEEVQDAGHVVFTVIEKIPHPTNTMRQAQMLMQIEDKEITDQIEHEFLVE